MIRKEFFLLASAFLMVFLTQGAQAASNDPVLQSELDASYNNWRSAMMKKDAAGWSRATARHRQQAIKNRVVSERRSFPQAVFEVPAAPPSIKALKALRAHQKGRTATSVYFGKVDFGVGGKPSDNVLVLYFVREASGWKYDNADFISLEVLPEVRKQLKGGNYSYVDQPDFKPTGMVPAMPQAVAPAQVIAKVYAFCPGREVRMKVNQISDHRFQDTKAAEIVIGGAKLGVNEVQFATKALEGSTGKEPLCIRVYLMSTTPGVNPVKIYEYLVKEGGAVKPFGSKRFTIDKAALKKLKM